MSMPVIIQGTLQSDGSLKLDQAPNLPPGPVVVTLQPAPTAKSTTGGLAGLIDEIQKGQRARALQGRSAEDIEAVRQEGEAEYEKRMETLRSQTNAGSSAGGG